MASKVKLDLWCVCVCVLKPPPLYCLLSIGLPFIALVSPESLFCAFDILYFINSLQFYAFIVFIIWFRFKLNFKFCFNKITELTIKFKHFFSRKSYTRTKPGLIFINHFNWLNSTLVILLIFVLIEYFC